MSDSIPTITHDNNFTKTVNCLRLGKFSSTSFSISDSPFSISDSPETWLNKPVVIGGATADEGTYTLSAADDYNGYKLDSQNTNLVLRGVSYTIDYKDQGGAAFSGEHEEGHPTQHTYGTATTLKTATKTGYTFDGWFKVQDCSGDAVTTIGATEYTANITLYAHWTANTYTVKFDANGGSGTMEDQSFTYDAEDNLTANSFTCIGKYFAGWSETADGEVKYADKASVTNLTSEADGTVTLYAKWNAIPRSSSSQGTSTWATQTYTVTFSMNGHGAEIPAQYVAAGSYAKEPVPAPAADGFVFTGWYTDQGCADIYSFSTPVASDLTLYAGWNAATPVVPTAQTPAGKSPAPLAGVLAGLGAAGVLGLRMRK